MGFVIAFIIAALSGMGVGGGGLFALWLKLFSDHSQIQVQALNLIFFFFSAGAALIIHLQRRQIYALPVALMICFGLLGSALGSSLALVINGAILGKIFGAMMIGAGLYSFFQKKRR